jgi:hypothetical protein
MGWVLAYFEKVIIIRRYGRKSYKIVRDTSSAKRPKKTKKTNPDFLISIGTKTGTGHYEQKPQSATPMTRNRTSTALLDDIIRGHK